VRTFCTEGFEYVYYVLRCYALKQEATRNTSTCILYYCSTPQNKKDHTTHYHHLTTGASSSMVAVDTVPRNAPSQSSSKPSSLPSAGPSNKRSKDLTSSVASTRSHRVDRAPSLPRNPVPVLRTNHQRSRVVWPRHGRT
jgi:hypothetical protein